MKKYLGLFLGLLLCFFVVTGCEKVENGNYKEGTYYGSYIDTYGGTSSVATAVVYVDTVYKKGDVLTTKKTLKGEYGMKPNSEVSKEWYEQVNLIEAKVIENQNITFIGLNSDGKTEAIAGVTMKIDALYNALNNALEQAKK